MEGGERIEAALSERAIDAHQDGLGEGATIALVGIAVLVDQHGGSDRPLGRIIIAGDGVVPAEGQQLFAILGKRLTNCIPGLGGGWAAIGVA